LGKINIALFVVGNKKFIFFLKKIKIKINPNKLKKTITKTKLEKKFQIVFFYLII